MREWDAAGNLWLDSEGYLWRRGRLTEDETVDPVCLGSIEREPEVLADEECDRDWLAEEWARSIEEGRFERAERWSEWQESRGVR